MPGHGDLLVFAADVTVKVLVLLAVAAVAARLLRRKTAAARHRVWCLALCGALVVPGLAAVMPQWGLPVLPASSADSPTVADISPIPQPGEVEGAAVTRTSEGEDKSTLPAMEAPLPHDTPAQPAPAGEARQRRTDRPADAATRPAAILPTISRWLPIIWAAGFVASVCPLVVGSIQQRLLLKKARPTTDARSCALLAELRGQLGLGRSVRLFEIDDDVIPMTWGVLRPLVLLPRTSSAWSPRRRRMVLLHELAHIERLDLPLQWLARIALAVYWFNPLAWYALGRLRDECEQACDDWVLHRGEPANDYATELVDLAETHYALRAAAAAAVAMARTNKLEHRVRSIVDPGRSHRPLSRKWTIGSLVVAGAVVLLAVVIRPVPTAALAEEGPPKGDAPPAEAQGDPSKPPMPGMDALGDPLPEGALLRFGTLRFRPPMNVSEIALSPNEKTLVSASREFLIAWDTATGKEKWRTNFRMAGPQILGSSYGTRLIAFTPDGRQFYTPGLKNEVMLWDVETGESERIVIRPGNFQTASPVAVDLSPDGKTLALGNDSGVVVKEIGGEILYEVANRPKKRIEIEDGRKDRLLFGGDYSFVRFSPDGKMLAAVLSEEPNTIRLLESGTGRELRKIALAARLVRLAFSPDGKRIVATERDSAARLYDVETGRELWSHVVELNNPYENYTSAIAFSPDGKTIAVCATDYRIYLFDPESGDEIGQLRGHVWYPWCLAFAADSKLLYSSGWDATIRRWDVAARKQLSLAQGVHASPVCAYSPDGRTIAYGDDRGKIHLVDPADGAERRTLELPGSRFVDLTFSPDGRQLAGGGISGPDYENVQVTLWNLPDAKVVHRWEWPEGRDPHSEAEGLRFSPQGDRLAAAVFRQGMAFLWDLTTGEKIAELPHRQVYGLSFSPDGETLATAGWDKVVRFWESSTGRQRDKVKVEDRVGKDGDLRMYTVCYAPEGGLLATAHLGEGVVRVWDADGMELRKRFQLSGQFSRFTYPAMSFSPDGLWLAAGSQQGEVSLWDPLTGDEVWDVGRHQDHLYKVDFGPDGRTLLTGGDDGLCYLWDLRPPGAAPDTDPERLWDYLAGEDSRAAYQAMWDLAGVPQRAIALIAGKLRSLKSVSEADPAAKVKKTRRSVTVRRGLAVLVMLGTGEAKQTLKELAGGDPNQDVARLARGALHRLERTAERDQSQD